MSSNDLSQVRDYIQTRLGIVEPDFREWTDSLANIGNIPQTLLDKSYHIELGPTSSTHDDNVLTEIQDVNLTVWRRGYNTPSDARDALMQTANCIRLDLVSSFNVNAYKEANDANIEDCESVSLTPTAINVTNDDIVQVTIALNVTLLFATT